MLKIRETLRMFSSLGGRSEGFIFRYLSINLLNDYSNKLGDYYRQMRVQYSLRNYFVMPSNSLHNPFCCVYAAYFLGVLYEDWRD